MVAATGGMQLLIDLIDKIACVRGQRRAHRKRNTVTLCELVDHAIITLYSRMKVSFSSEWKRRGDERGAATAIMCSKCEKKKRLASGAGVREEEHVTH